GDGAGSRQAFRQSDFGRNAHVRPRRRPQQEERGAGGSPGGLGGAARGSAGGGAPAGKCQRAWWTRERRRRRRVTSVLRNERSAMIPVPAMRVRQFGVDFYQAVLT